MVWGIVGIVFTIVIGVSKAIVDLSEEGRLRFKPSSYWLKDESWVRKWKDGDPKKGERFIGSSTVFVALTDGWHLFGLIGRVSFVINYVSIGYAISKSSWYWFLLLSYPVSMLIFHIVYNKLKWQN